MNKFGDDTPSHNYQQLWSPGMQYAKEFFLLHRFNHFRLWLSPLATERCDRRQLGCTSVGLAPQPNFESSIRGFRLSLPGIQPDQDSQQLANYQLAHFQKSAEIQCLNPSPPPPRPPWKRSSRKAAGITLILSLFSTVLLSVFFTNYRFNLFWKPFETSLNSPGRTW